MPVSPALGSTRLVFGPNVSLSDRQAALAFLAAATVAFGIAIGMALLGYWPVVPFAGLEVGALGAALWVCRRRGRYREVVEFREERVLVRFGELGLAPVASLDWPRAWTRVELAPGGNRLAPTVLKLRCSGQAVTLGRCLTDAERKLVCARLKQLLSPGWRVAADPAVVPASGATGPAASPIPTGE